jgi:hypothetical protein
MWKTFYGKQHATSSKKNVYLWEMIKVPYISVPKGLPSAIVQDNKLLKAVCVFYQLKSLYIGGIIHDYTKKYVEIANTFGYSDRKLRTYLKFLIQEGFATIDKNKSLVLISSKKVAQRFEASENRFYKIPADKLSDLENVMKALALEENIGRQDHIIEKKLLEIAFKEVGIKNPTILSASSYRRYRKAILKDLPAKLEKYKKRYIETISNLLNPGDTFFPFATLTRQGIANCLGRKSKATGARYAKLLKSLDFLTDTSNVVHIGEFSYEDYLILLDSTDHDYTYKLVKGILYKVLPNNISIKINSFLL